MVRAARKPRSSGNAPNSRAPRALRGRSAAEIARFLFFGSDPPPQCGELNGQIARMQANLADLQARAGGGAGDLIARYNAECGNAPPRPTNFLEALFGGVARLATPQQQQPQMDARFEPLDHGSPDRTTESGQPADRSGVVAHAGSYAVCVRTCDGSFFPVSYSGAGSRADSLEEVCRALCPNADVALYSFPFGGTIDEAESASGEPYANLPNAGKFEQSYDPGCSCRRKGESWAEALADAEARYGHEKHDIIVTPEKSAEMARPIIDPKAKPAVDPKAKPARRRGSRRRAGGRAWRDAPWRRSERAGPRHQRNGHQTQRRDRHGQPRSVRHRRRRRPGREELQRESGANGGSHRTGRGQTDCPDSRASALARPISGRRAASSGPASRPVNAKRKG